MRATQVKQRWHPIKRNYDLYRGYQQFASIEGNFLAWEFVLRDEAGGERASIRTPAICRPAQDLQTAALVYLTAVLSALRLLNLCVQALSNSLMCRSV